MKFILCGFKRSGKTSFGKAMAKTLGLPFLDVDKLIQEKYAKNMGVDESIQKIYLKLGRKSFREYETSVILALEKNPPAILSLGGGSIISEMTRHHLPKIGRVVYLDVPKDVIKKRILEKVPTFLAGDRPEKAFEKMYEDRLPLFLSMKATRLNTSGKSAAEILDELIRIYHEQ